jgi:hypothetical protein
MMWENSLRSIYKKIAAICGSSFGLLILISPVHSQASNVYLSQDRLTQAIQQQFGSGSFVGNCNSCHTSPPALNAGFGRDFSRLGGGLANMTIAQLRPVLANVANVDSDGDTFINSAEFTGNSDAGDSNSVPSTTPTTVTTTTLLSPPTTLPPSAGGGEISKQGVKSLKNNPLSGGGGCGMKAAHFQKSKTTLVAGPINVVFFVILILPILIAFLLRVRLGRSAGETK